MLLLYTLDQSVDLFLIKLFVNCLYRMNAVTCCVYSWITVMCVLYFCNINVTDGVFFLYNFDYEFAFDYRDMMITRLDVKYWSELGGLQKKKKKKKAKKKIKYC
jgi:hypothetical protein